MTTEIESLRAEVERLKDILRERTDQQLRQHGEHEKSLTEIDRLIVDLQEAQDESKHLKRVEQAARAVVGVAPYRMTRVGSESRLVCMVTEEELEALRDALAEGGGA